MEQVEITGSRKDALVFSAGVRLWLRNQREHFPSCSDRVDARTGVGQARAQGGNRLRSELVIEAGGGAGGEFGNRYFELRHSPAKGSGRLSCDIYRYMSSPGLQQLFARGGELCCSSKGCTANDEADSSQASAPAAGPRHHQGRRAGGARLAN